MQSLLKFKQQLRTPKKTSLGSYKTTTKYAQLHQFKLPIQMPSNTQIILHFYSIPQPLGGPLIAHCSDVFYYVQKMFPTWQGAGDVGWWNKGLRLMNYGLLWPCLFFAPEPLSLCALSFSFLLFWRNGDQLDGQLPYWHWGFCRVLDEICVTAEQGYMGTRNSRFVALSAGKTGILNPGQWYKAFEKQNRSFNCCHLFLISQRCVWGNLGVWDPKSLHGVCVHSFFPECCLCLINQWLWAKVCSCLVLDKQNLKSQNLNF